MKNPVRHLHQPLNLSRFCWVNTDHASQNSQKKGQLFESAFYKCLILLEYLVEPGGIEPPSASPPQPVLHA